MFAAAVFIMTGLESAAVNGSVFRVTRFVALPECCWNASNGFTDFVAADWRTSEEFLPSRSRICRRACLNL